MNTLVIKQNENQQRLKIIQKVAGNAGNIIIGKKPAALFLFNRDTIMTDKDDTDIHEKIYQLEKMIKELKDDLRIEYYPEAKRRLEAVEKQLRIILIDAAALKLL